MNWVLRRCSISINNNYLWWSILTLTENSFYYLSAISLRQVVKGKNGNCSVNMQSGLDNTTCEVGFTTEEAFWFLLQRETLSSQASRYTNVLKKINLEQRVVTASLIRHAHLGGTYGELFPKNLLKVAQLGSIRAGLESK